MASWAAVVSGKMTTSRVGGALSCAATACAAPVQGVITAKIGSIRAPITSLILERSVVQYMLYLL
jgi:hypothetical protein